MAIRDLYDEDIATRRVMARNTSTSPRLLTQLAEDDDPFVRVLVATNPNTPEDVKDDMDFSGEYLYGLSVTDADRWGFDDDEWMYHLNSGYEPWEIKENAVILSNSRDSDDYEEPEWWKDTLDFLEYLNFDYGFGDFIEAYRYDNYKNDFEFDVYADSDEAWEEALTKIYDAYREYGNAIEFKFAAVEALHPDLTFERVDADDPWGRGTHVIVFYNYSVLDPISSDTLQTWYFWNVYEARSQWLDLERLFEGNPSDIFEKQLWELFEDYGDYGDEWEFIEGPDFRAAQQSGTLLELLADELNFNYRNCILI